MVSNLHVGDFLTEAVSLITTDQPIGGGDLGLKVAMVGDLKWLLLQENLTSFLPMVLVFPERAVNPDFQNMTVSHFEIEYFLKAILIDEFARDEQPTTIKVANTSYLADVFMTDPVRFTGPGAGVQVLWNAVPEVDYTPPEEVVINNAFEDRIWASTVTIQIATSTPRV